MAACVYCHKAKGKRSCPALGGLICARCCGKHRITRIACPPDCIYLATHEGYQRERTAQAFAVERSRMLQDIKDREAVSLLPIIEAIIYTYFAQTVTAMDGEVIAGIEEVRHRLSPITIPGSSHSAFGNVLWKDLESFIKEADRQSASQSVDLYIEFARSFSGTGLRSHRFLRGLFGFLELYHPDIVKQIREVKEKRIIKV